MLADELSDETVGLDDTVGYVDGHHNFRKVKVYFHKMYLLRLHRNANSKLITWGIPSLFSAKREWFQYRRLACNRYPVVLSDNRFNLPLDDKRWWIWHIFWYNWKHYFCRFFEKLFQIKETVTHRKATRTRQMSKKTSYNVIHSGAKKCHINT